MNAVKEPKKKPTEHTLRNNGLDCETPASLNHIKI